MGKLFLTLLVLDKSHRLLKESAPARKMICSLWIEHWLRQCRESFFPESKLPGEPELIAKKSGQFSWSGGKKLPVTSWPLKYMQTCRIYLFLLRWRWNVENLETWATEKNSISTYSYQISLCFLCFNMKKFENREINDFKVLVKFYSSTKKKGKNIIFINMCMNVSV